MKIFVYSGTHWDREWYKPYQGFRAMLVGMTDDLLTGLENTPDYGVFHFDGQTVVLEDYLEIRPEQAQRLGDLIRAGRIVIGPWYDMPDEFLVSGESMIKNLRLGREICHRYGVEPAKVGYVCDIFGHSSQTPQIFAGMDIHHALLGRGTNEHEDPAHFLWEALDGTQVVTFRLREKSGYGDFGDFINTLPLSMQGKAFDRALKDYIDDEIKRCGDVDVLCLMDATDFRPFRAETPRYIDAIRRLYPDAQVYHASISEMARAQAAHADRLAVRRGELCRATKRPNIGYCHTITNTLSSRYPIKQYNDRNQTKMEKWVSPLYAFGLTSMAIGFEKLANKLLLQNHPHDSICGCSIDQVHRDMMYRFDQTRLIGDEILLPFFESLKGEPFGAITVREEKEGKRIRIYNPHPYRMKRSVTAHLEVSGLPTYAEPFGYEQIPAFRLYDAQGEEIPYGFVRPLPGNQYEIAFACTLTPLGVTEIEVRPSALPTRNPSRLLTSPRSAEGDALALSVNLDGTVNLTDQETGQTYENLLTMIDDGEIGDGWYHCCPNIDTVVSPTSAEVRVIENSPVRVTFRIEQKMDLPQHADFSCGVTRSAQTVDYRIVHEVTLAKGDRGITVHTVIDNNAMDHRLRLRLPRVAAGARYEAAQAFGYVTRACGDDQTTADWKEYQWADRNMANLCAKRQGNRGLGFLSASGLHECGVWENGDMDVTLMRCFKKTVGTAGEPDGELQQRLDYTYRIQLYTEKDSFASLQREQDFLATGLHTLTVEGGGAVAYAPMLEIMGDSLIYSTAGMVDGARELRLFNDSPDACTATVKMPPFATCAALTELDGRHIASLAIQDGMVSFPLREFGIATIRFS